MKSHTGRLLLPFTALLFLMTLAAYLVPASVAAPLPAFTYSYEQINSNSLKIELTIADYVLSTKDKSWSEISVAGLDAVALDGHPLLPSKGGLFGIGTEQGLELRVLSAEYSTHQLPHPMLPATTFITPELLPIGQANALSLADISVDETTLVADSKIYAQDQLWPIQVASIGDSGYLRDQAFAQIQLNPVRYNPIKNELRIYAKIVVAVTWDTCEHELPRLATCATPQTNLPATEQLIEAAFVNYNDLNRPPTAIATLANNTPPASHNRSSTPALKITIDKNGWYALTAAELAAAGWNTATLNTTNLQLHHRGNEIAITINPDNSVGFYAEGYEDIYVKHNVYWLSQGTTAGRRIDSADATPISAPATPHFTATAHAEINDYYWNTMVNATEGEDFWFWDGRLSPNASNLDATRPYTIGLGVVSTSEHSATLRVRLKGYTSLGHETRLLLNGVSIDQQVWAGQIVFDHVVPITSSLLLSGDNIVTVETIDTGAVVDQLLVDWVEITYGSAFSAENNTLTFSTNLTPTQAVTITDLTTNTLTLLDITQPYSPTQLTDWQLTGANPYTVTATLPIGNFLLSPKANPHQVATITAVNPTDWHDSGHAADYIVISHSDFITTAQQLAAHRQAQGLRTTVVDVADLYNEFNHGFFAPVAIRTFLEHSYDNWQAPAPSYVILIGDGSQDYKDNLNSGSRNFIPPEMINTSDYGQIPSDNYYVTFKGSDPLAEMQVGRLSAETITHATTIVNNIITYDSLPAPTNPTALFVADDGSTVFEFNSQALIDRLPDIYTHTTRYARQYTTTGLANSISHAITSTRPVLVNYSGHGNYYRWGSYTLSARASERIWTEAHTDAIADSQAYSFHTIANCLNGFFSIPTNLIVDPYDEAMAEALQRKPSAAVAVWADAGFGYTSGQRLLMTTLYDEFFTHNVLAIGNASETAKLTLYNQSTVWEQNVRTMTLFGDPVTQLPNPNQVPLAITHSTTTTTSPQPLQSLLLTLLLLTISITLTLRVQKSPRVNLRQNK